MPSGVIYVAPTVWHGVIQNAFTKALESRDAAIMSRFHDYCQFRRTIEDTRSNAPLTPDQRRQYLERCAEFHTPAFDALYKQFFRRRAFRALPWMPQRFHHVCFVSTR